MTPEETAELFGHANVLTPVRINPRQIKSACGDCGARIDPLRISDGIAMHMPDGDMHFIGLCSGCSRSLDTATHQETVRRLKAIRAKAFS